MAGHLILNRISGSRRETISTYLTSINWPSRFRKRHPDLKGLFAKPIEKSRNDACTPKIFKGWFNRFKEHFDKYKPDQQNIYNIDETGFVLGDGEKFYAIIDKHLTSKSCSTKAKKGELLTAIECVSSACKAIPPMIIYQGAYLQHHWFEQ